MFSFTAQRHANIMMLPAGIRSVQDLVWYRHDDDDAAQDSQEYFPCRICKPAEARHLRLDPDSWDPNEVTLVQALVDANPFSGRDRILVNKTCLQPYYGTKQSTHSWCPDLWKVYQQQRRNEARRTFSASCSDVGLQTTRFYLERILQHARQQQQQRDDDESDPVSSSSDDDDDDDDERKDNKNDISDDLEVPYAENLLPNDDDFWNPDLFSDKQTEPLRPGDVIQYTHPIYRAGDKQGQRVTAVLSTDPHAPHMLVLDNGEVLPNETSVKRVKVWERGTLYPHPHGFYRPIDCFKIEKRGHATAVDGLKRRGQFVGRIVDDNLAKFAQQAQANGFAPMDIFHKRSRKQATVSGSANVVSRGSHGVVATKDGPGRENDASLGLVSSSSKQQQRLNAKTSSTTTTTTKASDSDSDSSSDSSIDKLMSDPRKLQINSMVAKLKERGLAAFDTDSDDEDEAASASTKQSKSPGVRGNNSNTKPASTKSTAKFASKKATRKAVTKTTTSVSMTKVTTKKPASIKTSNKPAASKMRSDRSEGSSNKTTSRNKNGEPPRVPQPGEWLSVRRNTRESLGIDSDVTSLASAQSIGRNGTAAGNELGVAKSNSPRLFPQELDNGFSQGRLDDSVVVVEDGKTAKRKGLEDSGDDSKVSRSRKSTTRNKSRQRSFASCIKKQGDSCSDDSMLGDTSARNRSSLFEKAQAKSPVVDLINSPPRKKKPKRASYGSRGKSRFELGTSSIRKKKSSRKKDPNSLSFQSSSDDSSVDMQKYVRCSSRDNPLSGRKSAGTSRATSSLATLREESDDSDSSLGSAARGGIYLVDKEKSPVLDLTGSDSVEFGHAEKPLPPAKAGGAAIRSAFPNGRTKNVMSRQGASLANDNPSGSFGLSLTKNNVPKPKRRSAMKQHKKQSFTSITSDPAVASPALDSSDSKRARKKKLSDDLSDWGTFGGKDAQSTSSKSTLAVAPVLGAQFARNNTQSTSSSGNTRAFEPPIAKPFAPNAGDDLLVDSSSDDDLLSDSQSLPRKRLFHSSQWRSSTSHASFSST